MPILSILCLFRTTAISTGLSDGLPDAANS